MKLDLVHFNLRPACSSRSKTSPRIRKCFSDVLPVIKYTVSVVGSIACIADQELASERHTSTRMVEAPGTLLTCLSFESINTSPAGKITGDTLSYNRTEVLVIHTVPLSWMGFVV